MSKADETTKDSVKKVEGITFTHKLIMGRLHYFRKDLDNNWKWTLLCVSLSSFSFVTSVIFWGMLL